MELLLLIGGLYILGMMHEKLTSNNTDTVVKTPPKNDISYYKPRDFEYVSPKKSEETIVNNYYTQLSHIDSSKNTN